MLELNIADRCFTVTLDGRERAAYNQLVPDGYIPIFEENVKEILTEYIEEVIALLSIQTVARDYSSVGSTFNGRQIELGALSENTAFLSGGAYSKTKKYTKDQIESILRHAYELGKRRSELYPLLCSDFLYPLPYVNFEGSHVCPAAALPVRNAYELIMVGLLYPTYPIYVQRDFTVRSSSQPYFKKDFSGGELIVARGISERTLDIALGVSFSQFLRSSTHADQLLGGEESDSDPSWEYGVLAVWQDEAGTLYETKIISNVQLAQILTKCSSQRLAVHLIIFPYDTSSDRIALVQNVVSSFRFESKLLPRLTVLGLEGAIHPTVLTDPITAPDGKFFYHDDEIRKEAFMHYAYGRPHLCRNVTHVKAVTVLWTDRGVESSRTQYEHFSFPAVYNVGESSEVVVGVRATLQSPPFKVLSDDVPIPSQVGNLAPGVLSRSCQPFMASWEFLVRTGDVCDFLRLIRSHRFPYSPDPTQFRQLWSSLIQGQHLNPLWDFIARRNFGGVVQGELQWLLSASDPNIESSYPPDIHLDNDQDSFDISVMLPFLGMPSPIEYHSSGTRLPGVNIATTYDGDNAGNYEEDQLAPYCKIREDEDPEEDADPPGGEGDGAGADDGSDGDADLGLGQSGSPLDNIGSDDPDPKDPCGVSTRSGLTAFLLALGVVSVRTLWLSKDAVPKHTHRNMLPLDSESGEEFI